MPGWELKNIPQWYAWDAAVTWITRKELIQRLQDRGYQVHAGRIQYWEGTGELWRGIRKWHDNATNLLYPESHVDVVAKLIDEKANRRRQRPKEFSWVVTWHDPNGSTDVLGVANTPRAGVKIADVLLAELQLAPTTWEDMTVGQRSWDGLQCAQPFWRMRFAEQGEIRIDRYEVKR